MTRLVFIPSFLVLGSLLAAGPGFNGRWDITVKGEPRNRAWWLGIEGAGTPHPKGAFISAFGGALNPIEEISVHGNQLTFGFRHDGRHLVYKATLAGGRLQGIFEEDGKQKLTFTGVRAPVIRDKEDGTWKKASPVDLFNGRDMSGWKPLIPNLPLGWKVENGVLVNTPKANNLITDRKFWNFELDAEFRVGPHSNSGIGLRGRYEVQILEDYGRPPDAHSNGALYSRIVPSVNASKPAGEWQTYHIRLVGRTVTVVLNGRKIIDKGEIDGLTAIAVDPNEGEPGPLILQGDHGSVEFRKLVLTPLTH